MSTPETHAARAYRHLRDKLIAGCFAPGERLRYGPIGQEIGVSATPVREAAARLANEGLVDLVPQRGAVVRQMTATDIKEIYEVRLAIEPFAAALAAERIDNAQLKKLATHLRQMRDATKRLAASGKEFAEKRIASTFDAADYGFHLTIIEATGNKAMIHTADQSHVLTRVFGIRRHTLTAASMQQTCEEHAAIQKAIHAGQPTAAAKASEVHINRGLTQSLAAIDDSSDSAGG